MTTKTSEPHAASGAASATTSGRTISAAAIAAEQRYIDRSAWLTFTSSNVLSARGPRKNDLLPQLFDVASQRSPPQRSSARGRQNAASTRNDAAGGAIGGAMNDTSPMVRGNNSWYSPETASEKVDKVASMLISFDSNPERSGKREVSSASRARKLKQTDQFSLSRDPAFTSERHTYQVSGTDIIRRDNVALRFHTLQVPDAQARMPYANNTTTSWPVQASSVFTPTASARALGSSIVLSPSSSASSASSPVSVPTTPASSSSRRRARAAAPTAIAPSVWKTSAY